jgi:uncharacterized protein YndB with AHSA1/START domain
MTATTKNRHGSATVTLQGDREILIARQFDAPAALVFKAMTTPELVKRWWGFDTSNWLVCDIDLRVGGTWRYVTKEANGMEVGFHGEYREITAPYKVVSTEAFEGMPDADTNASLNTVTLEEHNGVTTMTTLVRHTKPEHRDMHIASGMEGGMQVSYDRLETLVSSLDNAA